MRFAIKKGSGEQVITSTKPTPTGRWTHVGVVGKGGVGTLDIDGEEVGRNAALTLTPDALGQTTQNYLGRVEEFKIPGLVFRKASGFLPPRKNPRL